MHGFSYEIIYELKLKRHIICKQQIHIQIQRSNEQMNVKMNKISPTLQIALI